MGVINMVHNNLGLTFIVPAYNEEKSITNTLNRLLETLLKANISYEIIVVNDGSQDEILKLVERFQDVKIINHPVNIGYGNAIKSGIKYARYDWIGCVDADGSYPIEDIPLLLKEMEKGFDMVIGSRNNLQEIDKTIKNIFRFIFNNIIKFVVTQKIEDPNSGLRIFKRELAINLFPFLCGSFSFTTSLTILATGMSCFIKYVPIRFTQREGKSKVHHFRDSFRAAQYIVQGITFFNPIKFFVILSFGMIFIVCIPAMFLALFRMFTLSLYYMIFGTTVTMLIGLGVLGDIIRISASQKDVKRNEKTL